MKAVQPDLFAPPAPRAAPRHCKACGICDPLPPGLAWAKSNLCSDCVADPAPKIARGAHQTEPCPVAGCRGWRHPLATMCDACKTLIPRELLLELMRASNAERFPSFRTKHGPIDRAAVQKRALEAAAAARANVSRATGTLAQGRELLAKRSFAPKVTE